MSTENGSSTNYSASANDSTGASANSSTSQDRAAQTGQQRQVSRQQGQASGQTLDTEQQAWQSSGWQSWQSPQQAQQQPQQAQAQQQYAQGQYRQASQYAQGQYAQGQYPQGQYAQGQYGQYRPGSTGQTPRQQMAAQQQRQANAYRNAQNGTAGIPNANVQGTGSNPYVRGAANQRKPTYRTPDGQYRAAQNEMYESAATNSGPTWRDTLKDYSVGIVVVVIIIVLLVVIVSSIVFSKNEEVADDVVDNSSTVVEEEESDDTATSDDTASTSGYSLSTSLLDLISSGATLSTFSLSSASAPTLSDSESSAISTAIAAIEAVADVGFVFYDVDSGLGISYNVDTAVYGAGSYKAPYALYICEDLIEGGIISLTDVSSDLAESLTDAGASTYITLRDTYDSVDYDAWATALGVTDALYTSESHYPWYCARSAAKLWTEIYLYIQTGTETAQWLEDELSEVTTSFIRVGVNDADATVVSRSGAYAGTSSTYNSLCDAGYITIDGHTYIMCVMTYMADSDENRELLQDLVAALYAARDELSTDEEVSATTETVTTEDETEAEDDTTDESETSEDEATE